AGLDLLDVAAGLEAAVALDRAGFDARAQGLGQGVDASGARVLELDVVAEPGLTQANRTADDLRSVGLGYEAAHPLGREPIRVHAPQLGVVGHEEVASDAAAKLGDRVGLEAVRLAGPGLAARGCFADFDQPNEALLHDVERQAEQVGLKRILELDAVRVDLGLARDRDPRIRLEQLGEQRLAAIVTQVQPVTGYVKCVALLAMAARVTAHVGLLLDQQE